jgi:hypothetical protein
MHQTGKTGEAYLYSRGAQFKIGRDYGYHNDVFRDFPEYHHANRGLVPRQRHNSLLPNPFTSSFIPSLDGTASEGGVHNSSGAPQVDNSPPPIISSKDVPKSQSRDPAYCRLSDQNPVRRNPQHILMFCTSGGLQHRGVCGSLIYAIGLRKNSAEK